MRIAIFTPSFLPKCSGAEIFHHNLASELVAAGDEVTVIMPRKLARSLQATGWVLPYGVAPFPGNIWSYFKRWPALARAWSGWHLDRHQRKGNYDLWHGVMAFPTGVCLIPWARRRGIPHLIRSAGDDLISSRDGSIGVRQAGFINTLIRREIPRADAVVALSQTIAQEVHCLGLAPERIHEIPNAVAWDRFHRPFTEEERMSFRASYGLAADRVLFLAVGRNHPQKNYPALLDAVGHLVREGLRFQVLLLGRDTERVAQEAAARGWGGFVRAGEIRTQASSREVPVFPPEALIAAYRSADVFIMPSILEGFSTALLEAMAAGLPVITTDAPGCRDFVRDGRDALMVPAGEVPALQSTMARCIREPGLRTQYAEISLARAKSFTWSQVTARYHSLYEQLLATKRNRKQ